MANLTALLTPNNLLLLPPLLLTILLIRAFAQAYLSPLRSVPGPFLARFTRLWYLRSVRTGEFEKVNRRLHEKYGPIVRIAPNECTIDDPAALKTLYGHGTKFVKAPWYDASGTPNSHDMFTEQDPRIHTEVRRKVASLYSMTSLLQVEGYVSGCCEKLMKQMNAFAGSGKEVNLQLWMQFLAFDAIAMITLDKSFGFLESGEDTHNVFTNIDAYLNYLSNVGVYSELHKWIHAAQQYLPKNGRIFLLDFVQGQIAARMAAPDDEKYSVGRSGSRDFLSMLIEMHRAKPDVITTRDVFGSCMTNIGAGSDTTSISLTGILYYLHTHQGALRKLREELDAATMAGKASPVVSFTEAQAMPYLQACIKEGLRMHPVTGFPLARVVPEGGALVAGMFLNAGTVVGANSWVTNYNQDVYGADAEEFRPERWLEGSAERLSAMERSFLTFGSGSRTCVGKNISLMEISKVVPTICRDFDFEFTQLNGEGVKSHTMWFVKQLNLGCRVSRRQN